MVQRASHFKTRLGFRGPLVWTNVMNRADAMRMGQSAARLTRSLYTWDITAATHLRMYQSLWTEASESSAWAICDGSPADREGA